ncbi:MAG: hypothetical protein WCV90_01005 [Candidatus Woesearchaeota archaeon]
MELKDKVESAYVALAGNRVTAIAGAAFAYLSWKIFSHSDDLSTSQIFTYTLAHSATGFVLWVTQVGGSTWRHYKRTLREVEDYGRADPEFFRERIEMTENGRFMGYCQLQGLYLGAKKSGQLANFERARRDYSECIIPNF